MNSILRRRRGMMGAQNKMVLTLGTDFIIRDGNATYLMNPERFVNSWSDGLKEIRRACFSETQINNVPNISLKGSGNTGTFYPLFVPDGATIIKEVKTNKTLELSIVIGSWDGSSVSNIKQKTWVPMTNIDLEGRNLFTFCFRVDSSNTPFDSTNIPTEITVEFG